MYRNPIASSTPDRTAWEQRFCPTDWCPIETVYALRYEHDHGVWRVTPNPGEAGWLVASVGPVCPICGANLLTAANISDGVEMVDIAHPHQAAVTGD